MRTAFIEEFIALALERSNLLLAAGDLGFSVVEGFAAQRPAQFLNAGIAEQNMTGLAAGLAAEGHHVFTYSIANFPTFRCAEQIRNDVAYHGLPVTIVAVGGGLSYGNLGYSHHAVQDYALMRLFPGMTLCTPGDPHEVRACLRHLVARPGPSYLRLGKAGEPVVRQAAPDVAPWAFVPLAPEDAAKPCAIVSTGAALALAAEAARVPELAGRWGVHSVPLWSAEPDAKGVAAFLARHERVVVVEDHLPAGGFASALREALAVSDAPGLAGRLGSLALDPAVCGLVGSQQTLHARGGLTVERLVAACLAGNA